MSRPIKMGIVGCGNSARNIHYPKLKDLRHQFEVVACYDVDSARASGIAELYGARAYTDRSAFFHHSGLELVLIATRPLDTHVLLGVAALEAGKHVILEKPMCASHEEGVRLIATARKMGRILTVYQSRRWDPEFLELRWAISQGFFGNIRMFESLVCNNILQCEWLVDWGVHLIDQCLVVCGGKPLEVNCAATFPDQVETGGGPWTVCIRFDNGRLVVASMKTGALGSCPRFSIVGDEGGCAWPEAGERWKAEKLKCDEKEVVTDLPVIYRGREKEPVRMGEVRIPFCSFYSNLYDVLTGGAKLAVKPEEALAVIDVIQACLASVKKGGNIALS